MHIDGDKIRLGADLTKAQMEVLQKASPTGDQILDNLDSLNEEIDSNSLPKAKTLETERTVKERPGRAKAKRNYKVKETPKVMENELDAELEKMEREIEKQRQAARATADTAEATENVAVNSTPEEAMKNQIIEALKGIPDSPSQEQIEMWKRSRGKNSIYVMAFSESDVYIYSFLTRGQHQKIQEIVKKAAEVGNANIENMLKEKVVQNCVLWPKPLPVEFFYNSRAGIVDGLYEAIMIQSGFLSPQQLMLLTTQL